VTRLRARGSDQGMATAFGVALVVLCAVLAGGQTTFAAQPPEDQLPAAPLLVAAYSVVWALAIGYLWTIWRRLGTVEQELADVSRRVSDRERS